MQAVKCDQCGKYEDIARGHTLPSSWLAMERPAWTMNNERPRLDFCSALCLVGAYSPTPQTQDNEGDRYRLAIRDALEDLERRDEVSAVAVLRWALSGSHREGSTEADSIRVAAATLKEETAEERLARGWGPIIPRGTESASWGQDDEQP